MKRSEPRSISLSLALLLIGAALLLALNATSPETEAFDSLAQSALILETQTDELLTTAKNNQNTP